MSETFLQKKDRQEKVEESNSHVPVEREVVIGIEPPQVPVQMSDLKSTRQLEGIRAGRLLSICTHLLLLFYPNHKFFSVNMSISRDLFSPYLYIKLYGFHVGSQ